MRCLSVFLIVLACVPARAERALVEWKFDSPGALQSWRPNAEVVDARIESGALRFRCAGPDPIVECVQPFEIAASPWQTVEVRLKADRDGQAALFWSDTTQSPYGGFSPEKYTTFAVAGDSEWHTYRVFPFWQKEGKIIRLRFDPYDGARFELASIRIVGLGVDPLVRNGTAPILTSISGTRTRAVRDGTIAELTTHDGIAAGAVSIDADKQTVVALNTSTRSARRASIVYSTEDSYGLHEVPVTLVADGRPHTYNVDMLASPDWKGRVVALGIRPGDRAGESCRVHWLRATDRPVGPAELRVLWFGVEDALPRSGVPIAVSARITNSGGAQARHVSARLIDALAKAAGGAAPMVAPWPGKPASGAGNTSPSWVRDLAFGQEAEWRWRVVFPRPGRYRLGLDLDGAPAVRGMLDGEVRVDVMPRIKLPGGVLPPPKPVHGKFEVGAYYFPGWKSASQWAPITRYPGRRPVLGWYREGDPSVADWQIRWAVEHGITFFAYDWYWSQGSRQLEHALDDGFLKSKYRRLMKFCLLWANHNAPHTSSIADCVAATRYCADRYFRQPEYLKIQGRPVVIIFSPYRFREDLGNHDGRGVRQALDAMREECRNEGLAPLYLIACVGGTGDGGQAAREGYDAITAYNWPGLGVSGGSLRAPYSALIDAYRRNWQALTEGVDLPLLLPLSGGWDNRAWAGDSALVRYGRNPALFRKHLQDGRRFMESHPGKALPLAIVEAWNEFGEGSYVEPQREFGFGYLDAIRDVFGESPASHRSARHMDLTPADAGVTVPQVAAAAPDASSWSFRESPQGWDSTMGMSELSISGGALRARTTSDDPAFFGPTLQIPAARFRSIVVRMRLTPRSGVPFRDEAQVFWSTRSTPESEANSIRFAVSADGKWHECSATLPTNPRWRSIVTRLRLDPCSRSDVLVELASIRLVQ